SRSDDHHPVLSLRVMLHLLTGYIEPQQAVGEPDPCRHAEAQHKAHQIIADRHMEIHKNPPACICQYEQRVCDQDRLKLRHAGQAPDTVVQSASVKYYKSRSHPVWHGPEISAQIFLRYVPWPQIK